MEDIFTKIQRGQNDAQSLRKKGDAFLKVGRNEQAFTAYEEGAARLADLLDKFVTTEGVEAQQRLLRERAEMFGSYGGLMQRLNRPLDALKSYQAGGTIEEQIQSPSTYNRLNAIKGELLSGQKKLDQLRVDLEKIVKVIDGTLEANPSAGDSGWLWADLGDSLALLGHLDRAQRAYLAFMNKSETKSPERTLDVLRNIAAKLKETASGDAPEVDAAIQFLESRLKGSALA